MTDGDVERRVVLDAEVWLNAFSGVTASDGFLKGIGQEVMQQFRNLPEERLAYPQEVVIRFRRS